MCGIVGVVSKKAPMRKVAKLVRYRYELQKTRGSEAFGYVVVDAAGVATRFRSLDANAVFNSLRKLNVSPPFFVVFHHRLATSAPNIAELTHPFVSCDGNRYLVHNGIVYGHEAKFKELCKKHTFDSLYTEQNSFLVKGTSYVSDSEEDVNDSEILLHLFEEDETLQKAFDASSSIALIVADAKERKLIVARNGNPMRVQDNDRLILFSSENTNENAVDLKPYTKFTIDLYGNLQESPIEHKYDYSGYMDYGSRIYDWDAEKEVLVPRPEKRDYEAWEEYALAYEPKAEAVQTKLGTVEDKEVDALAQEWGKRNAEALKGLFPAFNAEGEER